MFRHLRLIVVFAFVSLASAAAQAPPRADTSHPYLLLYAFNAEGAAVESQMTVDSTVTILGRPVVYGRLADHPVALAESGVGMTNAAMTTQRLIDRCSPRAVLFTGIAGAIDSSVMIGDIVVCSTWVTHDFGYIGADGFAPGPVKIYQPGIDSIAPITTLTVDRALFATARREAESTIDFDKIGDRTPRLHVGGAGASGNSFIDSKEKRLWLSDTFDAMVVDMESAAVVQVCSVNDVPVIVFRSASDLAGGSGSDTAHDQLSQFFKVAAENSARVLIHFLGYLPR